MQPLVVRKGMAAPASAATSASGSGGSSYCASPAPSLSPARSPGGAGSPQEMATPGGCNTLSQEGGTGAGAVSPVARVAQTLRRLVGGRKVDLEVKLTRLLSVTMTAAWLDDQVLTDGCVSQHCCVS